jgi:hypothetical protein
MKRIRLCGADTLVRETLKPRVDKARANAVLAPILRSFTVFVAALREIFDESAYQRFLDRTQLESSPQAYTIFRKENEQAKSRRPRCC